MNPTKYAFIIKAMVMFALGLTTVGCATRTGNGSTVHVQLSNQTASALRGELRAVGPRAIMNSLSLQDNSDLLGETPLIYEMKLVAFYLVGDVDANDNNVGDAKMIWVSNKCDAELYQCGIGPAAGEYQVDYFNLAAGTAAVNEALANYKGRQSDPLGTGTFRYVRMDLQGATGGQIDITAPNLKFGSDVAHEVRGQYGFTIALPEPLVLEEGDSVTVDLAYDLENAYYESTSYYPRPAEITDDMMWTCDGIGSSGVPCVVEPQFTPTVIKN